MKVKIGIDASNIRMGGGVTHLSEILREVDLDAMNIERIIVWGSVGTLAVLPKRSAIELVHQKELDDCHFMRMLWQARCLPALASRFCDVLFSPGAVPYFTQIPVPVVSMSQNMLPFQASEAGRYGISAMRLKLALLNRTQAFSFARASGLIFLTEHARREILNSLQDKKLKLRRATVIPHGVSERFLRRPRTQLSINRYSKKNPFKLLYVSTIAPYKHQWNVAEAIGMLRQKGIPLAIDFVGTGHGPSIKRLERAIRKWDADRSYLFYRRFVPFADIYRFYHQADAFVFASSCENQPNVLLEAMASGLPIASSSWEPMRETLDDAGHFFNPEDSLDIARSLEELIMRTSLRGELAGKAYERARQCSWTKCAEETFVFLTQSCQ